MVCTSKRNCLSLFAFISVLKMNHSRSYSLSVINHNTIIPKKYARYHETINTVIMPLDYVYKITSITCKIDTTSLRNIPARNAVKVLNNQVYEMIFNVCAGYYMIDELFNAINGSIAINENNQAYEVSENAHWADLSGASNIANILKLEGLLTPPAVASEPCKGIDEFEDDTDKPAFFPF